MTDHIGKATTMIDLDALEKLAGRIKSAGDDRRYPRFSDMEAASDGLTALIAELKEARGLLSKITDTPSGEYDAAAEADRIRAFLARNGKGEGQ